MSTDLLFGIGVLVIRVLQIIAGMLFFFLGYRLFAKVPTSEGTAQIALSEHLKLNFSKVGPGVFLSLFGAAILIQGLANPLKMERATTYGPTDHTAQTEEQPRQLLRTNDSITESTSPARERAVIESRTKKKTAVVPMQERLVIVGQSETNNDQSAVFKLEKLKPHIRFVNTLLDMHRPNLSIPQQVRFEVDQKELKLALLSSAWDQQWGDFSEFAKWARGQRNEAPNADLLRIWDAKQ